MENETTRQQPILTTPKIYTALPQKSSSLKTNFLAKTSNDGSSDPHKITTIRFKYPFLTSENPTTPSMPNHPSTEEDVESTTSYGIGGHARPHMESNDLFKMTQPPGL